MKFTEEDYNNAMVIIEGLMDEDPEPDTVKGASLNFLAELCQRYETEEFGRDSPG